MLDSGATHHFCNDKSAFLIDSLATCKSINIRLGDNSTVTTNTYGKIILNNLFQISALYVPTFRLSLFSLPLFDKRGWKITMADGTCTVKDKTSKTIIVARMKDNLYRWTAEAIKEDHDALITTRSGAGVDINSIPSSTRTTVSSNKRTSAEVDFTRPSDKDLRTAHRQSFRLEPTSNFEMWHRRLAHLNTESLSKIINSTDKTTTSDHLQSCTTCIQAKNRQSFIRLPTERASKPFELVHSDVCGPMSTPSISQRRYYIIYIDDFSRFAKVYFLKSKSTDAVLPVFQEYKAWIESQGHKILRFRCDNGTGEFNNQQFRSFLAKNGISFEPSPPFTQHKNGTAERFIQTINGKARSMLLDAQVPHRFWAEAVNTAVYLHSISPTRTLKGWLSPHEALFHRPPQLLHLRRFGCTVFKHTPKEQRTDNNWSARASHSMMVGYTESSKIWRIYDFNSRSVVRASNVVFLEDNNAFDSEGRPNTSEEIIKAISDCFPDIVEGGDEDASALISHEIDALIQSMYK